jgi:putative DNA primase/helicase
MGKGDRLLAAKTRMGEAPIPSTFLAVIDLGSPKDGDFIKDLNLPECPISISGNSVHRWYRTSFPIGPLQVSSGDGTFIEVRIGNMEKLNPDSIEWLEGHSPREIPFPELPMETYQKIKALPPKSENPTRKTYSDMGEVLFTAEDFCRLELPPRQTYLIPWLTEGSITLVWGWRGIGKTWILLGIVDAITKGLPFGPWAIGTPVPCLYVDSEMPRHDMKSRLEAIGHDHRVCPLVVYSSATAVAMGHPKPSLVTKESRDEMLTHILVGGYKVVVFDNLSTLAMGIDENSKKEFDPINEWLLELRFYGITSLIAHHAGKEGDQRGTSAREDNIDNSILLVKPVSYEIQQGARFIVKFKKARTGMVGISLLADSEFAMREVDGQLQWTWAPVKKVIKVEILQMLNEGTDQKNIAEVMGVTPGRISQIKADAIRDNLLDKEGKLTEKGYETIDKGKLV